MISSEKESSERDIYNVTKRVVLENFKPNSNTTVERMKFRACQPSMGDDHYLFIEKLKRKAEYCKFDEVYRLE